MGARLRLKAGRDISSFPADVQKIFRAFQKYGLIVADNGTDIIRRRDGTVEKDHVIPSERAQVAAARAATGLSQAAFARLLGVSVRTLQEWEQGRKAPSGAAVTLLRVAARHPHVLKELAA